MVRVTSSRYIADGPSKSGKKIYVIRICSNKDTAWSIWHYACRRFHYLVCLPKSFPPTNGLPRVAWILVKRSKLCPKRHTMTQNISTTQKTPNQIMDGLFIHISSQSTPSLRLSFLLFLPHTIFDNQNLFSLRVVTVVLIRPFLGWLPLCKTREIGVGLNVMEKV
jgi:hypothetical protein